MVGLESTMVKPKVNFCHSHTKLSSWQLFVAHLPHTRLWAEKPDKPPVAGSFQQLCEVDVIAHTLCKSQAKAQKGRAVYPVLRHWAKGQATCKPKPAPCMKMPLLDVTFAQVQLPLF
jgi:hypothetical protein